VTVVAHTRAEYATLSGRAPGEKAVVPTMGALHAGHLKLVEHARESVGSQGEVVVTIFVNPTQFGIQEDLASYPRPFMNDIQLCTQAGVDLVFAPLVEEMYPSNSSLSAMTSVEPGPIGDILEGADRPGHFSGVLTVVAKLLNITQADHSFFGEKDYQQLALITNMVKDLDFPVQVHGVPTVRDSDGLAMSSRNTYLSESERVTAGLIPQALFAAQSLRGTVADKLALVRETLSTDIEISYIEAMSLDLSARLTDDSIPETGRLLIAANIGSTRLIDNCAINADHSQQESGT